MRAPHLSGWRGHEVLPRVFELGRHQAQRRGFTKGPVKDNRAAASAATSARNGARGVGERRAGAGGGTAAAAIVASVAASPHDDEAGRLLFLRTRKSVTSSRKGFFK